jgi:hypothetical protein
LISSSSRNYLTLFYLTTLFFVTLDYEMMS